MAEVVVNREELAWAAGFFDGEGNARTYRHSGGNRSVVLNLQVTQSGDKRVLERFQKAVFGLGKLYGPYTRNTETWQPRYRWESFNFEEGQAIIVALFPFLSPVKQRQCLKALGDHFEFHNSFVDKNGKWRGKYHVRSRA